jgi:hypothetical protein
MTTQYTPILKLALPVQGELSGTWGDVVNDNITSMVEQAIAGRSVIDTWSANSHVLTTANGTTAESRAAMLSLTDSGTALTGAGSVICPALSKVYIVKNGTAQVITVKTAAGSGIAVPVGKTMLVYCDGTNVLEAVDHVVTLSAGTLTITGLTTFASLKGTGAVTVTNILDEDNMASDSATALATQQSIKAYVDSQVGTVDTLSEILAIGNTSGANNLIIDNGQAITTNTINETTAASGVTIDSVLLKDDGVNATNLEITNLKANDGTSAGSIADSTGVVTLASSVLTTADINGGTIDGTVIGGTTAAAGSFTTGAFSGAVTANDGILIPNGEANPVNAYGATTGSSTFAIANTGGTSYFGNESSVAGTLATGTSAYGTAIGTSAARDINFFTSGATRLTIASTGAATFSGAINQTTESPSINLTDSSSSRTLSVNVDDNNSFLRASGPMLLQSGGSITTISLDASQNMALTGNLSTTGGAIFNESGADADFRVESDTNANMLFVDGGANHIGMGTATLNRSGLGADHIVLTVGADTEMGMLELQGTRTSDADLGRISFLNAGTRRAEIVAARIDEDNSTKLYFQTSNAGSLGTRLTIGKDGAATFSSSVTADRIGSKYVYPTDATSQTGEVTNHFWKMGRMTLAGPAAAEIELHGLTGYGQGDPIAGKNIIQLRGSNSATVLGGTFHATGDLGIGIQEMRYVPIGDYVFDLYVKLGPFTSLSTTVTCGGTWAPEWTNTGSGSNPASSVDMPAHYALLLGNNNAMYADLSEVVFNDDSNDIDFRVESDTNTHALFVQGSDGNVGIGVNVPNKKLTVTEPQTANTAMEVLRLSGSGVYSSGGSPDAGAGLSFGQYHDTYPSWNLAQIEGIRTGVSWGGSLIFKTNDDSAQDNATERLRIASSGGLITNPAAGGHAVFNEGGVDADFRVESDGNAYMFYIDAGTDTAYFGGSDNRGFINIEKEPPLASNGAFTSPHIALQALNQPTDNDGFVGMSFALSDADNYGFTVGAQRTTGGVGNLVFRNHFNDANGTEMMAIKGSSGIVFNEDGNDQDFRVESDTNANMFVVDASTDRVGVGVAAPLQTLHVAGSVFSSSGYYITVLQGNAQLTNASTSSGSNASYIGQGLITVVVSDAKAKENFGAVEENECLNKIVSLSDHVKKFDWIDEDWKREKGRTVGMVAQEVYEDHSEFVHKPENYNDDGWAIRYQEIVPTLIKAFQEQQELIKTLEARITALES